MHRIHRQSEESGVGVESGAGLGTSRPIPRDPLPSARLYLQFLHNLPKESPAGDQLFKPETMMGHFTFKPHRQLTRAFRRLYL